ncbi:mitochondrial propionyl-CoA carboxylase, beta subunit, precursor [Dorcoceras hygrometricum]|uniref:Mitochondrial propionyl-CoA carboxylase, beta subunit n=1 Tax=Dorcoceras hygrometricum TaxID=472368 RepID=A0A2Z7CE10_9LAMI|nr:mitochondrial propionyl-CoA carboxylase, beta subunit, precursor [Dorcoceras hygrometricum]
MGIDQLGFQSVQPGYLLTLKMGNTDPTTQKQEKNTMSSLSPSAITARWSSDTTNQSVTTPMIALDLSGTTHLSAGHNVALSQLLLRHGNFSLLNWLPRWSPQPQQELPKNPEEPNNAQDYGSVHGGPVMVQARQGRGCLYRLVEPRARHVGRHHRATHGCFIACVGRALHPTVRIMARPRGTTGPGGGPADGAPAKGCRNRSDEGLVVGMVKWQHRGVGNPEKEHAEPLGSLDLNDAGDPAVDFIPTGGGDL